MAPVSARDVAAELRKRLPGLRTVKLHKLLYYCQGHHLATFDEPLFNEPISAYDRGPIVGSLWYDEKTHGAGSGAGAALDEAALNTIGYVLSRYGALTGSDLIRLTHTEDPWVDADARRAPKTSATITTEAIQTFFRRPEADEEVLDDVAPPLDVDEVSEWLRGIGERQDNPGTVDSIEGLRARLSRA